MSTPNHYQQTPSGGTIPKFASFKPKDSRTSVAGQVAEPRDAKRPDTRDARKPSLQDAKRFDHDKPYSHRDPGQSLHRPSPRSERRLRHESPARGAYPQRSADTPTEADNKVFTVDKRGDTDNVKYGSVHRYSVPLFARFGSGSVLGTPVSSKIDRDESTENDTVIRSRSPKSSWTRKKNYWFLGGAPREEISVKPSQEPSNEDFEADFLPLRPRKRRRADSSSSGSGSDEQAPDYRSISVKANAKADRASSTNPAQESQQKLSSDARSRVIELSRLVEKEPQNGKAWLDLVAHQDVEQGLSEPRTLNERSSMADIKLSIISKSLKRVQDTNYKELLLVKMMEESAHIRDPTQMRQKWDRILEEHSTFPKLWIAFLNFIQTEHTSFRFDDLRDAFTTCFQNIREVSPKLRSSIDEIYLLLRLTICMREAGYLEQAVAVWQANLELNFFKPQQLANADLASLKSSFEAFWEGEARRIGEQGALGWDVFFGSTQQEDAPSPHQQHASSLPKATDAHDLAAWYVAECAHAAESRMPARSDEVDGEDPYRVVFSGDIGSYILDLKPPHHDLLVQAFLLFCGMPPLHHAPDQVLSWWQDPFLHLMIPPQMQRPRLENGSEENGSPMDALQQSPFSFNAINFLVSADTLFNDLDTWFSIFPSKGRQVMESKICVSFDWVRRTLRTLVDKGSCSDDLAERLLAIESRYYPQDVRKTAKALLKRRSSSLRLYNAYALIEYRLGNKSAADKVLSTAISMSGSQPDKILLWRTWIQEALYRGEISDALEHLLALPLGDAGLERNKTDSIIPSKILGTKEALIAYRDLCMSEKEPGRATLYIECLIILSYLNSSDPLEAALSVFKSNVSLIAAEDGIARHTCELLRQSFARLLCHHLSNHAQYRPSLVRDFLSDSVNLYPRNTIFLSLLQWSERRFRVDDRVRAVVQMLLHAPVGSAHGSHDSFILLLFNVHTELSRAVAMGSNVHSIRHTFERAVASGQARHSPALWTWFYDFEISRGNKRQALAIAYRAITACPWAKELYVLPLRDLADVMEPQELQAHCELLESRELRMHIPFDEFLQAEVQMRKNSF